MISYHIIWQLFSIRLDLISKVGWTWSNGVRKSEMSIIWCISITNNVIWFHLNHAQNSMKQLKRPTSLISHWFSVEMVQNGPKLCKRANACFSIETTIWGAQGAGYTIWKLMSCWFRKCNGFPCFDILSYGLCLFKFGSNLKKDTASILCSRLHINRIRSSHSYHVSERIIERQTALGQFGSYRMCP